MSIVAWIFVSVRGTFAVDEGAGFGAVSIDINPVVFAIPVVPPIGLIVAWLIRRRRKST